MSGLDAFNLIAIGYYTLISVMLLKSHSMTNRSSREILEHYIELEKENKKLIELCRRKDIEIELLMEKLEANDRK